ncbi:MAG TPA: hypothetical protein VGO52_15290 [Hyphomonadaceae bacterium]|nr:hypothetical protein [Hyphomonadaceae bacterium]
MAIEFSSGETTIGALVNLRGDIAKLRRDVEAYDGDDCLHAESGEALAMLDDVIASLTRRARDSRAVRVNQPELDVISAAVFVSKALAFFRLRAPDDNILQRLH